MTKKKCTYLAEPRTLVCVRCEQTFCQPKAWGAKRRYCDACRKVRERERKIQIRFNHLEAHLRPMVKAIVIEVLADLGIPMKMKLNGQGEAAEPHKHQNHKAAQLAPSA